MSEKLDRLREVMQQLSRWEAKITESIEHGRSSHTFDDIVAMVLQGRVQFFSFSSAFAVMEKVIYPQFSVYHCFLAGGEMGAVMALQKQMEDIGIQAGCKYLSIAGRKGWEKQLKDLGWSHVCTTLYLPIGETEHEWWKDREANTGNKASEKRH